MCAVQIDTFILRLLKYLPVKLLEGVHQSCAYKRKRHLQLCAASGINWESLFEKIRMFLSLVKSRMRLKSSPRVNHVFTALCSRSHDIMIQIRSLGSLILVDNTILIIEFSDYRTALDQAFTFLQTYHKWHRQRRDRQDGQLAGTGPQEI
ncbi:hypothetical protein SeLEV6574_g05465 [Synchytrium endobioticum]|uniref:Uncharacterized protein n=1 Tax=Synchytrium endobioticum TaxID=286115 RepID=A0A507CU30_9FUNG|nr:hypothetical protein SeLEV6574_g05465 [Synchytrium endobioticum]